VALVAVGLKAHVPCVTRALSLRLSTAYLIPTCSLAESNSLNRWLLLSDYICWGAGSDSKSGSILVGN